MTAPGEGSKASAYDRYIDYKRFALAVAAFLLIALIPTPESMVDVAVEYTYGEKYVLDFFTRELFATPVNEAEQWQVYSARALEGLMRQGTLRQEAVLKRDAKQLEGLGAKGPKAFYERYRQLVEGMDEAAFNDLMGRAKELRFSTLSYDTLKPEEKAKVDTAARQLKICVAMIAFVVICFITEAMPLPGVAFCVGLICVFSGMVTRKDAPAWMWTDATWFIMGSLMFAAAFVKTGVDKRICLALFRMLAKPNIRWVTLILVLVMAPSATFISDHALAAMFLPIGIILYSNSLTAQIPKDSELAKMLMITICMAPNIGGFGAPSGGARNVIMINYMEDMFGYSISYGQWVLYGMPFVIIMMPILWLLLNWRFKPQIRDLTPAMESLKRDIARMGKWNRAQITAVIIFLAMFVGWLTEDNILKDLLGFRLGIGVLALAGAVAYLLFGIVNWRDYQEKVDWGVVWLYAGAMIFGRVLDQSGAAYWLARSLTDLLASIGLTSMYALLASGGFVTAFMTQLMADGPAAAAVGPITLNIAGVVGSGTTMIPFMTLVTAAASSFAYLLIIGTPPNAIVYASGYLEAKDFLRVGIPCLIIAFIVLMLMAAFYWPLLGFPGLQPM